jgi:RNA polymerase sigma-70 factor (ECF subfamily)
MQGALRKLLEHDPSGIFVSEDPKASAKVGNVTPFRQRQNVQAKSKPETNDPALDWQRLMIAAQAGDKHSYAVLLKEIAVFARIVARRFHSDRATIEDVVQDTLLSIHRVRDSYEPGRPVEPWVAAIARARAIDTLRAKKRRGKFEQAYPGHIVHLAEHREEPAAIGSEVLGAIEALPERQRAALRMVKIEEMSLADAAHASGQSVSGVKSLLHRAMASLRAALRKDERAKTD